MQRSKHCHMTLTHRTPGEQAPVKLVPALQPLAKGPLVLLHTGSRLQGNVSNGRASLPRSCPGRVTVERDHSPPSLWFNRVTPDAVTV